MNYSVKILIIYDVEFMNMHSKLRKSFTKYCGNSIRCCCKKVKSSMATSLPVENLLPQNVGSIINYLL